MVEIAYVNHAPNLLNETDLTNLMAAIGVQLNTQFCPRRGLLGEFTVKEYAPSAKVPPSSWIVAFLPKLSVAGALGYHDVTASFMPIGYIGVQDTLSDGGLISVTASHEICEMAGDPKIASCMTVTQPGWQGIWAYEACDQVEDEQFAYAIEVNGVQVMVSDFVFMNAFIDGAPGPYDFKSHMTAPLQILAGGYIGALEFSSSDQWTQLFGPTNNKGMLASDRHRAVNSRFHRRMRIHERGGIRIPSTRHA